MSILAAGSVALAFIAGGPVIATSDALTEIHQTITSSQQMVKQEIMSDVKKDSASILPAAKVKFNDLQPKHYFRIGG